VIIVHDDGIGIFSIGKEGIFNSGVSHNSRFELFLIRIILEITEIFIKETMNRVTVPGLKCTFRRVATDSDKQTPTPDQIVTRMESHNPDYYTRFQYIVTCTLAATLRSDVVPGDDGRQRRSIPKREVIMIGSHHSR